MILLIYAFVVVLLTIGFTAFTLYLKTSNKEDKKNKEKEYFNKSYIKRLIAFSFFKKMNEVLKEAGYPIDINVYIVLFLITIIGVVFTFLTAGIADMLYILFVSLVPLHIWIYKRLRDRRNMLQIALCDIQDIIYFQNRIGTSTDVVLASAARLAKEPLKITFEKVATCYKVTRDLNKSLDILLSESSMMEIKAFTFILKQKEITGYSEENHKAQSVMLKRNKRLRKRVEREMKRNKLLLASVLLFVCYISMIAVPMIEELFMSFGKIFR